MQSRLLQFLYNNALLIGGIFLCFLLYLPSLNYELLYSFDDNWLLVYNPSIQDLSFEGIKYLFYGDHTDIHYHPITYLSLAIDYHFFGPSAFHFKLHNLILHLLNGVLIYIFLHLVLKDKWVASTTALLFLMAAINIESVAWASVRRQMLSLLFVLLSLICYQKYLTTEIRKNIYLFLAIILWILSMLSKANFVILPGVFLLLYIKEKGTKNLFKKLFIQFVFFGIICIVILYLNKLADNRNILKRAFDYSALDHLIFTLSSLSFYVWKFVFPFPLGVFYPSPTEGASISLSYYLSSLLTLSLLTLGIYHFVKKQYTLAFLISLYFLNSILMANRILFPFGDLPSLVSDRYFYHNGLWIIAYLMLLIQSFTSKDWIKNSFFIVFLIGQIICFKLYIPQWKNTITLFEYLVKHYPSEEFYYRLGIDYFYNGEPDKAVSAYQKAKNLNKNIWINNGWYFYYEKSFVYIYQGNCDEVQYLYKVIKEKEPDEYIFSLYTKYLIEFTSCDITPMDIPIKDEEIVKRDYDALIQLINKE